MPASRRKAKPRSRYLGLAPPLDEASPFTPSPQSGLDAADLRIIEILWKDGRANNRSMTDRVGLTEETVAARIRSMVERHIIGITTIFNWNAAGYEVELWLRVECEQEVDQVVKALVDLDDVVRVWTVLGPTDVVAEVLLPDMDAAAEFLAGTLPAVEGLRRVEVSLTLDTLKSFYQFTSIPVQFERVHLPKPVVELDDLDWSIAESLAASGRDSNREIARTLGVSDGTVRTRIRRLEDAGLMRVCAQVDPRRSGMLGEQMLLFITVHGRDVREVARDLAEIPEVAALSILMGREAMMAYVAASTRDRVVGAATGTIRAVPGVKAIDVYELTANHKAKGQWARW